MYGNRETDEIYEDRLPAAKKGRTALMLFLTVPLLALPAMAQEEPSELPAGFRGEALHRLDEHIAKQLLSLAEAVPAEKYSWSPAEEVRSFGKALTHVAGSNYWFSVQLGGEAPTGVNERLKSAAAKDEVIAALGDSFDHFRETVLALTDADLEAPLELFGRSTTQREAVFVALTHASEHMGQCIAYARSIGVVPPWSQ